MTQGIDIRPLERADLAAVTALYRQAFPDEDLVPLVDRLARDEAVARSFVAASDPGVAGHAVITLCGVDGAAATAALLGPLAVAPARQRQGIGSALVREGLARIAAEGVERVFVLGDPAYYGRLGFSTETNVEPPYALPDAWRDAWQSRFLGTEAEPIEGTLSVPAPWNDPALWAP